MCVGTSAVKYSLFLLQSFKLAVVVVGLLLSSGFGKKMKGVVFFYLLYILILNKALFTFSVSIEEWYV